MKVRTKQVWREVFRYNGNLNDIPDWIASAITRGQIIPQHSDGGDLELTTPSGRAIAHSGDWIVFENPTDIYPVSDALFHAKYEVDDDVHQTGDDKITEAIGKAFTGEAAIEDLIGRAIEVKDQLAAQRKAWKPVVDGECNPMLVVMGDLKEIVSRVTQSLDREREQADLHISAAMLRNALTSTLKHIEKIVEKFDPKRDRTFKLKGVEVGVDPASEDGDETTISMVEVQTKMEIPKDDEPEKVYKVEFPGGVKEANLQGNARHHRLWDEPNPDLVRVVVHHNTLFMLASLIDKAQEAAFRNEDFSFIEISHPDTEAVVTAIKDKESGEIHLHGAQNRRAIERMLMPMVSDMEYVPAYACNSIKTDIGYVLRDLKMDDQPSMTALNIESARSLLASVERNLGVLERHLRKNGTTQFVTPDVGIDERMRDDDDEDQASDDDDEYDRIYTALSEGKFGGGRYATLDEFCAEGEKHFQATGKPIPKFRIRLILEHPSFRKFIRDHVADEQDLGTLNIESVDSGAGDD